ncbi:SRPBCC family protein [Streptomyces sp. NPDC046805]|uniref:SRPBCC family protein n=1 Tax=Streptomyces sp. NPDC046805 TaxID=3155134 RepID=UPI0033F14962
MGMVRESVEVEVPLRAAYNQWTQFEEFPNFMEGVEEVEQIDDSHNHWTTKIAGVRRDFDTEIVDQLADDRITWRTISGDTRQSGTVLFESLGDNRTRVELVMDVEPSGPAETLADWIGTFDRRVKGDMRRFKEFIEARGGHESGSWRGRITPG